MSLVVSPTSACSRMRVEALSHSQRAASPAFRRAFINQFIRLDEVRGLAKEFFSKTSETVVGGSLNWEKRFTFLWLMDWMNRRGLVYIPDSGDYWSTPGETLARGGGDCEDLAIILGTVLKAVGYPYRIWIALGKRNGIGHAWIEIEHPEFGLIIVESRPSYVVYSKEWNQRDPARSRTYWGRILIS